MECKAAVQEAGWISCAALGQPSGYGRNEQGAEVSKVWPAGRSLVVSFCMACKPYKYKLFTFLNGWKKSKEKYIVTHKII